MDSFHSRTSNRATTLLIMWPRNENKYSGTSLLATPPCIKLLKSFWNCTGKIWISISSYKRVSPKKIKINCICNLIEKHILTRKVRLTLFKICRSFSCFKFSIQFMKLYFDNSAVEFWNLNFFRFCSRAHRWFRLNVWPSQKNIFVILKLVAFKKKFVFVKLIVQ